MMLFAIYQFKIIFRSIFMAEYQYGHKQPQNPADRQSLNHYRIEIGKLQKLLKNQQQKYRIRILELEQLLKDKNLNSYSINNTDSDTTKLQIYHKDKEIFRLTQQLNKLRKIVCNPDDLLIKKKDHFDLIIQKDEEIKQLQKVIAQMENKYDGRYFNEHRIKKDYQLLQKKNAQLEAYIKQMPNNNQNYELDPKYLQFLKVTKELQFTNKENNQLKSEIKKYQKQLQNKHNRVIGSTANEQLLEKQLQQCYKKIKQYETNIQQLKYDNQKLKERIQKDKYNMDYSIVQPKSMQSSRLAQSGRKKIFNTSSKSPLQNTAVHTPARGMN